MTKDTVFMYSIIVFERVRSKLLRKPLFNFLAVPILFTSLFVLAPKVFAQTNSIHCYVSPSTNACVFDYSVIPNPDCSIEYEVPASCAGNPESCCTSQPPTSCSNVMCVSSAPIFLPCDPGWDCLLLNLMTCENLAGQYTDCLRTSGGTGTCCVPPSSAPLCSLDQVCTGLDPGLCGSVDGTYMGTDGCRSPTGGLGSCCQPGSEPQPGGCEQNENCEDIALGTCQRELGDWTVCEDESGNPGTCCVPERNIPPGTCPGASACMNVSGGCFNCEWDVALGCVAQSVSNTCAPQYEAPDSFCSGIGNMPDCQGCLNISCVQGGSDDPDEQVIGYFFDPSSVCHPCFEYQRGTGDFNCDPPEYDTLEACCNAHPSSCGFNPTGPYDPYANQDLPNRWADLVERYSVETSEIAAKMYDILYPIGLAIGLFSIIAAGYAFMTSQGQPDKVKDAQEKLTAAVVGILFIVLSIVILRVIIRTLLDPTVPF